MRQFRPAAGTPLPMPGHALLEEPWNRTLTPASHTDAKQTAPSHLDLAGKASSIPRYEPQRDSKTMSDPPSPGKKAPARRANGPCGKAIDAQAKC